MSKKKLLSSIAVALAITFTAPFSSIAKAEGKPVPNIVAKSALVMDADTGEIIYSKDADTKRFPASITKLLTGLILAENKGKSDPIAFTSSAKSQPQYSFDINIAKGKTQVGDTMSADDAMKALLLFSANDWAYAIADSVAGNTTEFSNIMNKKAKELGMNNTHFITPNGLHDENHYTTAYDLALLGKAAFNNPWVRETMALKDAKISTSSNIIGLIENRNKNLGVDGGIGGKTGYTEPAGKSLLNIYERDGRHLVGVVLKSVYDQQDTQMFKDMKDIIDYSYSAEKITAYQKDTAIKTVPVKYKSFRFFGSEKTLEVPLVAHEDIKYYDNEINKNNTSLEVKEGSINPWKLKGDSKIATLEVNQRDSSKSYDIYTNVDTSSLTKASIMGISVLVGLGLLIILAITIVILLIRKQIRRRRRYF
ncbi:D-alanyl-D-alanine carboxypeptidase family protein [Clostridium hydrogeniformans]|uniref:D-alanyl-D-alanine carboxypeptidase family protein n=1 Tax=Clostridium hydrogeniformans TaxID=349933 RepID=UPI00047F1E13|nr:D-alanyl-D-alanine carboxypeptidase family protein [Clostridium hydrogeniformans]